ncbi:MAG: type II secretion system GspH family protein [Candidatus Omnitrophica bacterium]|nr:type II secretion system GspH family protein [Candidatus Omnitrophota bacterium]
MATLRTRGFTLVEIMIVLAIIGLIVSIAVPAFLKNRRDAQGSACNGQLDSIYASKEQIAWKKNAHANGPIIPFNADEVNSYLRGTNVDDLCPGGGSYTIGDINDADGLVIVPICDLEAEDGGGGVTNMAQGLHIHRRSYNQDANGDYTRDTIHTFAN